MVQYSTAEKGMAQRNKMTTERGRTMTKTSTSQSYPRNGCVTNLEFSRRRLKGG